MNSILISYDLGGPETRADYVNLSSAIRSSYSTWARPTKSTWIVRTEESVVGVRDRIKAYVDANDKLIVLMLQGGWATYGTSTEVNEWLRKNL